MKILLLFLSIVLGALPLASAQEAQPQAASGSTSPKEQLDSPRFFYRQFLTVMRKDDPDLALSYMEFSRRYSLERKRRFARDLIDVLNRKGRFAITDLSPENAGKLNDGLTPDAEVIGFIDVPPQMVPITLILIQEDDRKVWRFSPDFIEQLSVLAEKIDHSDWEGYVPEVLIKNQAFGIKAWQWLMMGLISLLAFAFSRLLAILAIWLVQWLSRSYQFVLTDHMRTDILAPLRFLAVILVFQLGLPIVELNLSARQSLLYGMTVMKTLGFAFLALRLSRAGHELWRTNLERQGKIGTLAMLPPIERGFKILIVVVAFIFLLRDLGFDVTAIVAGLGVGGLAIALAGQKTLENLFGGISVLLDQPVRVGDLGRFGEIVGTVEDIGMRSTKIRTLDRTLIAIPNAEFSHMKLENYERRDKIRWFTTLGLRYDTHLEGLEALLIQMKELLLSHPMVVKDPARVRFVRFGAYALEIEIFAFINTTDWNEYLAILEDLNLRILRLVRQSGTDFAFPTSTILREEAPAPDRSLLNTQIEQLRQSKEQDGSPLPFYPSDWQAKRIDKLDFPLSKEADESRSG